MRPATYLAAAAALLAVAPSLAAAATQSADASPAPPADAAPAAPAADPVTTDMRCIVVAGALLGAQDEEVKSLGRANLFYYLGRLHGRGDVANMDARIVEQGTKMTQADIQAQAKICIAQFTAANQELENLDNSFSQQLGGGAAPK